MQKKCPHPVRMGESQSSPQTPHALSAPSAGACRFWTAKLEVDGLSPFPAWEPPSETVTWKDCSRCKKWRVVPPETENGGFFYCTQLSVWDPDHARCDASEEEWEEE